MTCCRGRPWPRSPDSVDAARDKHSTRAHMAKAGLPTPRNMLIERPDQIEAAGSHVGFPAGGPDCQCWSVRSGRHALAPC